MTKSPSEIHAGGRVVTPDGPGIVANLVRMGGLSTHVLVQLDTEAAKAPLWRSYSLDQVKLEERVA